MVDSGETPLRFPRLAVLVLHSCSFKHNPTSRGQNNDVCIILFISFLLSNVTLQYKRSLKQRPEITSTAHTTSNDPRKRVRMPRKPEETLNFVTNSAQCRRTTVTPKPMTPPTTTITMTIFKSLYRMGNDFRFLQGFLYFRQ